MTTGSRFDFSLLALAALLLIQASIASYGLDLARDVVGSTHARLAAVASATR